MKLLKILVIMGPLVLGGNLFASNGLLQKECDAVEATAEVKDSSNGLDNGQATITLVKGDKRNVKYIFCQTDGKVLNEGKFSRNTIDGLKKGTYICIVSTSDCSKNISFTIR